MDTIKFPDNFLASGRHIGIKPDETLDFGVIHSSKPCNAAGVFTRNNFPGNPVIVGRENLRDNQLQTIIVNSGNSNVATGPKGLALVREYVKIAADSLGIQPELILPSSTGVIGRPLPAEVLKKACGEIKQNLKGPDFAKFAEAIMTTDAYPKTRSVKLKNGVHITGIAKGAGMIQPDRRMTSSPFSDRQ